MRKEVYEEDDECQNCGSKWTIKYRDDETGERPSFCPFCGECLEDWGDEDDELDYLDDEEEL